MGIIADTSLVSNKVFTAIQPWQNYEEHTGTVIYANKYADVAEVQMPRDIRAILDSDAGAVGNNPMIQLQGKLQYLPDGPWYTDCRNGMLYIHNKKFREDSIHTYVYQSENGEVLRVSFDTKIVTHHDLAKAMNIDPKTGESLKSNLKEKVEEILRDLKVWGVERPDALSNRTGAGYSEPPRTDLYGTGDFINGQWYYHRKLPNNPMITIEESDHKFDYGMRSPDELVIGKGANNKAIKNKLKYDPLHLNGLSEEDHIKNQVVAQYDKQSEARKNAQAANAARTLIMAKNRRQLSKENNINSSTNAHDREWLDSQVDFRSAEDYNSMSIEVGDVIRESRQKKLKAEDTRSKVRAVVEDYIGVGSTHAIYAPVYVEEWVDPTTYSGNNTFRDRARNTGNTRRVTPFSNTEDLLSQNVNKKMLEMMNDPNIAIISDPVKEKVGDTHKYHYKVKIYHQAYRKVNLSAVDHVTDWLLRSNNAALDAELKAKAQNNKLANDSNSRVEKVLVVKMDVVGRPSLTSSQVLTILNVGKKWSGKYYVKECTHKMDASEGYICSLDLSKNAGKPGSETKTEKLSSNHIIKESSSDKTKEYNKSRGMTVVKSKPSTSTQNIPARSSKSSKKRSKKKTYPKRNPKQRK